MANTTNFGWETPDDTDLVKDGAAAMRTLGNSIDASFVDLKGGTSGQILSKNSNTDLDYTWITPNVGDITEVQASTGISITSGTGPIPVITNSMATEITASGDIIVGTGSGTFDNLPIGTTGQVLTADTTVSPYKVKWATPAAGGKVLQVVSASTNTETSNSTTTYADTTLTATITPTSATSTILVMVHQNGVGKSNAAAANALYLRLVRGASEIALLSAVGLYTNTTLQLTGTTSSIAYLDSPATTSATTYKTQFKNNTASAAVYVQTNDARSTITLFEIGA